MPATIGVTASAETTVERGVNEARMATFALIFATALAAGLTIGFETSLLIGILAGVATAVATALLLGAIYRVGAIRHLAMELMHRITGQ